MEKTHKIAVICVAVIAGLIVMSVSFVRYRAAQARLASPQVTIPAK